MGLWSWSVAGTECMVAAVADGHGSKQYDRSHIGAALAVRAAADELLLLQSRMGTQLESRPQLAQDVVELAKAFRSDFPRRLARRWRHSVEDDILFRGEDPQQIAGSSGNFCRRYGTTLLCVWVSPQVILVGQIGDGDILFLRPDSSVETPIAVNDRQVGGETDSLSSTEAPLLFQTAVLNHNSQGVLLLASDGLSNALEDGGLNDVVRTVRQRVRNGQISQLASWFPGYLDQCSRTGSGDDITVAALVICPPAPQPTLKAASPPSNVQSAPVALLPALAASTALPAGPPLPADTALPPAALAAPPQPPGPPPLPPQVPQEPAQAAPAAPALAAGPQPQGPPPLPPQVPQEPEQAAPVGATTQPSTDAPAASAQPKESSGDPTDQPASPNGDSPAEPDHQAETG